MIRYWLKYTTIEKESKKENIFELYYMDLLFPKWFNTDLNMIKNKTGNNLVILTFDNDFASELDRSYDFYIWMYTTD